MDLGGPTRLQDYSHTEKSTTSKIRQTGKKDSFTNIDTSHWGFCWQKHISEGSLVWECRISSKTN